MTFANALQPEPSNIPSVVLRCFGQICSAHAHRLLFPSFRSKFWHHRWIWQPWYVAICSQRMSKNCYFGLLVKIQTYSYSWKDVARLSGRSDVACQKQKSATAKLQPFRLRWVAATAITAIITIITTWFCLKFKQVDKLLTNESTRLLYENLK